MARGNIIRSTRRVEDIYDINDPEGRITPRIDAIRFNAMSLEDDGVAYVGDGWNGELTNQMDESVGIGSASDSVFINPFTCWVLGNWAYTVNKKQLSLVNGTNYIYVHLTNTPDDKGIASLFSSTTMPTANGNLLIDDGINNVERSYLLYVIGVTNGDVSSITKKFTPVKGNYARGTQLKLSDINFVDSPRTFSSLFAYIRDLMPPDTVLYQTVGIADYPNMITTLRTATGDTSGTSAFVIEFWKEQYVHGHLMKVRGYNNNLSVGGEWQALSNGSTPTDTRLRPSAPGQSYTLNSIYYVDSSSTFTTFNGLCEHLLTRVPKGGILNDVVQLGDYPQAMAVIRTALGNPSLSTCNLYFKHSNRTVDGTSSEVEIIDDSRNKWIGRRAYGSTDWQLIKGGKEVDTLTTTVNSNYTTLNNTITNNIGRNLALTEIGFVDSVRTPAQLFDALSTYIGGATRTLHYGVAVETYPNLVNTLRTATGTTQSYFFIEYINTTTYNKMFIYSGDRNRTWQAMRSGNTTGSAVFVELGAWKRQYAYRDRTSDLTAPNVTDTLITWSSSGVLSGTLINTASSTSATYFNSSGYAMLDCNVGLYSGGGGELKNDLIIKIFKNGVFLYNLTATGIKSTMAQNYFLFGGKKHVLVNAGDYIQIYFYHNSATPLQITTNTYLTIDFFPNQ
jgi:hypothetical protein